MAITGKFLLLSKRVDPNTALLWAKLNVQGGFSTAPQVDERKVQIKEKEKTRGRSIVRTKIVMHFVTYR